MSEWGRVSARAGGSPGRGRLVLILLVLLLVLLVAADIALRSRIVSLPFETQEQETIDKLTEENARLTGELEIARSKAASSPQIDALNREIERRGTEIARLKDERNKLLSGEAESVVSLRSENEQLRTVQIPALEEELAERDRRLGELESRLQGAEETAADLQARLDKVFNEEIPGLKNQLADRDAMLKQLDAEIARLQPLEQQLKETEAALATARTGSDSGDVMRKALEGQLGIARQQVAALRKEVETLKAANAAKPADAQGDNASEAPAQETASPNAAAGRQPAPRDPNLVARAMDRALGLDSLSEDQRDRIATGLIEGECVGKVLSEVLGRAPAVPLRDLIRALDSDC
jgi:biopolymer transport protein ExbD